MITFFIALVALILGYFIYGRFVERIIAPDDRETPAVRLADGVDYMVLPNWKIFMIQFLNIAGTGPIFGAIMGAWYGPIAYLWIVFGCIFAGAVHDYMSGMLSMRNDGAGLPQLIGRYLGTGAQRVMLVFSTVLLMLVGAVFVYSPAIILSGIAGSQTIWIVVIFIYYIIATMLPIDKIIGRIYPLFAVSLLFMALALFVVLVAKMPALPELWTPTAELDHNAPALLGASAFVAKNPVVPCLFITIACGAISGFHATQSPLMARCLKSERMGRPIFYGSMITEGIVALIWATVSIYFFYYGGWRQIVPEDIVNAFLAQATDGEGGKTLVQYFSAPQVVSLVCNNWLGVVGGILALLGVVAAPITSGDTALRSARLIVADFLRMKQHTTTSRLLISVPLFIVTFAILYWQISNPNGFNTIWQYFGWSNQALSVFTLWAITVYLARSRKPYIVMLLPALFMTVVTSTWFCISPTALGLDESVTYAIAGIILVVAASWFAMWYKKMREQEGPKA